MGLASETAGAISEGINFLCALLEWNDAGAIEAPPVDGAMLKEVMAAVELAMREILHGGRIVGAERLLTDADLERMIRLEELITEWPSTGALSPEVVTLAESWIMLWGGVDWKTLMANARRT